jgi:cell shape-determining protein MreC
MRVAARTLHERIDGLLTFDGSKNLLLKNVASVQPVKLGDTITTSDYSPYFPENIPIGTIAQIEEEGGSLFYRIIVSPMVNFSTMEEAFVVLFSPDQERIELEREILESRKDRGDQE